MIPENISSLIEKLKQKTSNKQANWLKTSRENEFKLELNKGAITTDNWNHKDVGMMVDFAILNEYGDEVERIMVIEAEEIEDYKFVLELHNLAKREYYNVDDTIKTIFDELDSDKIVGKERKKDEDLPF
jgi:hypothetical protein